MYKNAGFWKRASARLLDLLIIFGTFILLTSFSIKRENGNLSFYHDSLFYIDCIVLILMLNGLLIVMPYFTNGKTIGNYATKTQIEFKGESRIKSLIERELMFGIAWSFVTTLMMVFVNHTLAIKFISTTLDDDKYTTWEMVRINIPTSFSSIIVVIQLILIATMIVKQPGWNDLFAKTRVVNLREKETPKIESIKIEKTDYDELLKPKFIERSKIEWD